MNTKILLSGLAIIFFGLVMTFFMSMNHETPQRVSVNTSELADSFGEQEVERDAVDIAPAQAEQGVQETQEVQGVVKAELFTVDAAEIVSENIPERQSNVVFAPDFSLPSLDEASIYTLRSFAGEKPVIVDFFAAHCPNCRRNLPKLEALHAQYGDKVEVVLIGIDSRAETERYFANNPTNIPVVMTNNRVLVDYKIRLTNTKALINRDGSLLEIIEFRDIEEKDFLRLIES